MDPQFVNKVFSLAPADFDAVAQQLFAYQLHQNLVYREFCGLVHKGKDANRPEQLPFLPIRFFKTHQVTTGTFEPALIFESSGTTQTTQSRHLVKDAAVYHHSLHAGFERVYGSPANWCILGLLPSYLERGHSSLVYMVQQLIAAGAHPASGFYLHDLQALHTTLQQLEKSHTRVLLLGVTFALLDFAAQYPLRLQHTVIMETGGMKGRREELLRPEVHRQLQAAFGVSQVHSEYGMTELLSQAYSVGDGLFRCPPWMRVLVRDEDDPAHVSPTGRGALNIIDLANMYSCAFIATDDVGEVYADGSFRVLGRLDEAELRGCSLLAL